MNDIFGKKIKELRKLNCLTLDEVARRIRTSKGYISDIENANRPPPSDKFIRKLSKVLKIDKKVLLRLAHIDKIPDDIKQELQISKIITPKNVVEEKGKDLTAILKESCKGKKRPIVQLENGYVPIVSNRDEFPKDFEEFDHLIKNTEEYVQFSSPTLNIAFAIQMPDSSMERKQNPSFKEGSLVFFSEQKVKTEDFVFVTYQADSGSESIFRQLTVFNRGKIHLKALHPRRRREIVLSRRVVKKIWKAVGHLQLL